MSRRTPYEYETPGKPGQWTKAGEDVAKARLERRASVAGAVCGLATAALGGVLIFTATPPVEGAFLAGMLAVAAGAAGWLVYLVVSSLGLVVTDPTWSAVDLSRIRRPGRERMPTVLLLGTLVAVFATFAIHLSRAIRQGDNVSGWTAAVLAAVIFYPLIRYRIERGRWPS